MTPYQTYNSIRNYNLLDRFIWSK